MYDDSITPVTGGDPRAVERADTAARYLWQLDSLADEMLSASPRLPPATGRLEWMSSASSAYDARLEQLRVAYGTGVECVEAAREQLRSRTNTLRATAHSQGTGV